MARLRPGAAYLKAFSAEFPVMISPLKMWTLTPMMP
jgi:hypothetical protein